MVSTRRSSNLRRCDGRKVGILPRSSPRNRQRNRVTQIMTCRYSSACGNEDPMYFIVDVLAETRGFEISAICSHCSQRIRIFAWATHRFTGWSSSRSDCLHGLSRVMALSVRSQCDMGWHPLTWQISKSAVNSERVNRSSATSAICGEYSYQPLRSMASSGGSMPAAEPRTLAFTAKRLGGDDGSGLSFTR